VVVGLTPGHPTSCSDSGQVVHTWPMGSQTAASHGPRITHLLSTIYRLNGLGEAGEHLLCSSMQYKPI